MSEQTPHRFNTNTTLSIPSDLGHFMRVSTLSFFVLLSGGCSETNLETSVQEVKITVRHPNSNHFDNLTAGESIIGNPFSIEIMRPDGTMETVRAQFVDSMTIEIDGDTHTISGLTISGQSVSPGDEIADTGMTVESLVTGVTPNAANEGVCIGSSLGNAHVSKQQLGALFSALQHPAEGAELEQSVEVEIEVELSPAGDLLVNGAKVVNVALDIGSLVGLTESGSDVAIPDRCTITFQSTRRPPEKTETTPSVSPDAMQHIVDSVRSWFSGAGTK